MSVTFSEVKTIYEDWQISCRMIGVSIDGVEVGDIEKPSDCDWWYPNYLLEPITGDFGEATVADAKRAVLAALAR